MSPWADDLAFLVERDLSGAVCCARALAASARVATTTLASPHITATSLAVSSADRPVILVEQGNAEIEQDLVDWRLFSWIRRLSSRFQFWSADRTPMPMRKVSRGPVVSLTSGVTCFLAFFYWRRSRPSVPTEWRHRSFPTSDP